MKAILRSGFLALAILVFAVPADAGPLEDGEAAYEQSDYAAALKFWRPLAEQGGSPARYNLGLMYHNGRGVEQDDAEAVKWYRMAAERGHAAAQYKLGGSYHTGLGVQQDHVSAHMWYSLAAAQGNQEAPINRDIIAKRMTPDQVAEAERLARKWLAKHQKLSTSFSKVPRPRPTSRQSPSS
jgi:TPR repeat protein